MLFIVVLSPFTVPPPRCSLRPSVSLNSGHVTMPLESKYFYQSVAILSAISGLFEQMRAIPPLSQRDSDRPVMAQSPSPRPSAPSSHVSKSIRSSIQFEAEMGCRMQSAEGRLARTTKFTPFQRWRRKEGRRTKRKREKQMRSLLRQN